VIVADARPSTRFVHPAELAARQRSAGSGCAEGAADSAAEIAARFTACPPSGALTSVAAAVVVIAARHGVS
jgi:hypothetical protein